MPSLRARPLIALTVLGLSLALAACNSTNVDKDNDGKGGGGGGTDTEIGKVGAFDFSDTSSTAIASEISGEYAVAIWAAPDSLTGKIGKGTLKVEFLADSLRLILRDAGGATLASRSSLLLDRSCNEGVCLNLWGASAADASLGLTGPGRRVSIHHYYQAGNATNYFEASFYASGVVSGTVSGLKFRNSVLAYGATVPARLKGLAGTFSGPAQQRLCDPNPVTVDVNADSGSVRVRGKVPGFVGISATCPAKDLVVAWNGNDDLLVPSDTGAGVILAINAGNRGGSLNGGGLFFTLSASGSTFSALSVNFAGADGDITLNAPVKQ